MTLKTILKKIFLHCISPKTISLILYLFCFTFQTFAQSNVTFIGGDNVGLDVSLQFGGVETKIGSYGGVSGIGGRVGYYLGSIVFLDGEIFQQFAGSLVENRWQNEKTTILGGVRLGTIFDGIGVFAKARAGAFGFNAKDKHVISGKDFYPVFDVGGIAEYYFNKKIFLRFDAGDWIIPFGDTKIINDYGPGPEYSPNYVRLGTKHSFAYEIGFGFRF